MNSGYGKTAQGVQGKRSYNAWNGGMDVVGPSAVTNALIAAMTTAIVRCELIATMTQLERLGLRCYSVTTDGFITDACATEVDACDMFGLRELARDTRVWLTGDPKLWEEKHRQVDLVNFTTRGNVSLGTGGQEGVPVGVCAHAGLRLREPGLDDEEALEEALAAAEALEAEGLGDVESFFGYGDEDEEPELPKDGLAALPPHGGRSDPQGQGHQPLPELHAAARTQIRGAHDRGGQSHARLTRLRYEAQAHAGLRARRQSRHRQAQPVAPGMARGLCV